MNFVKCIFEYIIRQVGGIFLLQTEYMWLLIKCPLKDMNQKKNMKCITKP